MVKDFSESEAELWDVVDTLQRHQSSRILSGASDILVTAWTAPPDGHKNFTTTCGVAASGFMTASATLGSSALTTCKKITCGTPVPASFNTVSVRNEVFQDVMWYSRETGYNVSDRLGRWKRRF